MVQAVQIHLRNFLSQVRDRFKQGFAFWFWCILALSLLHRYVAITKFFRKSVHSTYQPRDTEEVLSLWWNYFGESIALGVSYDVLLALLMSAGIVLLARPLRVLVLVAFVFFLAANFQHIAYNHSNIELSTIFLAADLTFVRGMVDVDYLEAVAVLLLMVGIVFLLMRVRLLRNAFSLLSVPVVFCALVVPAQGSFTHPLWLQSNPLIGSPLQAVTEVDERNFDRDVFAPRQLAHEPDAQYNVLLVFMEGLSHRSIEIGEMETLQGLAGNGLSFERYLGPQLITANGLFSSLTGRAPYFTKGDLKWYDATSGLDALPGALPSVLRERGYQTSFLQSADLEYMSKGDIMPRLGFEQVKGRASWDHAYAEDGWGVDDRALFEHALSHIDKQDADAPWFVSVLTTGTHAPYNVPEGYMPNAASPRHRALSYLDDALAELMQGLKKRGLMENTIVVLTSDESRERYTVGDLRRELTLNWLPLVILHPSGASSAFDGYMSAVELPQLIVDLQKPDIAPVLARAEAAEGALVFGNVYSRRLYWFDPQREELLICVVDDFLCAEFDNIADPLTAEDRAPSKVSHFPGLREAVLVSEQEN